MKQFASVLVLMVITYTSTAQSCCTGGSCSSSSYAESGSMSTLLGVATAPSHLIGVRYSYSSYATKTYSSTMMNGMDMSSMGAPVAGSQYLHTIELSGRVVLPHRFSLSATLPFHLIYANTPTHITGLGDASLMVYYALLNPARYIGKKLQHQLRIGAGMQLPTGRYRTDSTGANPADLQTGTGSVGLLFNTSYGLQYHKWLMGITASYRLNTTNSHQFRFGNRVRAEVYTSYLFTVRKSLIAPTIGLSYSYVANNIQRDTALSYTGGQLVVARMGVDIKLAPLIISLSVSPVLVNIRNWTGESVQRFSLETSLYYNIPSNFKLHKNKQQ